MIDYVLGAPGSGKSALVPHLRSLLPGRVVLDWDAFMEPAGDLAGVAVREEPRSWESYRRLVHSVVEAVEPLDVVLLGVCTPEELAGWPSGRWMLLDCSDDERRRRLADRGPAEVSGAVDDASAYRRLGLPTVDTSGHSPADAARAVAARLR